MSERIRCVTLSPDEVAIPSGGDGVSGATGDGSATCGRCGGGSSQDKSGGTGREREPQAGRMVMVTSVRSLHVWSSLTCPLFPEPVKFTSESAASCSSCVTV